MQRLKFGKGEVISKYTLLGISLLIHAENAWLASSFLHIFFAILTVDQHLHTIISTTSKQASEPTTWTYNDPVQLIGPWEISMKLLFR